jgi:hypothetical protein
MQGLMALSIAGLLACSYSFQFPALNSRITQRHEQTTVWKRKLLRSQFLQMVVDTRTDIETSSPMSGFFTNSSPETRRVIPENMEGKTRFKIVYVVLESQYQSALTKACNTINAGKEGVAVEAVGYLLEELRNPKVFEQFKEDVGNANIFIGSLIFIQELADKVSFKIELY